MLLARHREVVANPSHHSKAKGWKEPQTVRSSPADLPQLTGLHGTAIEPGANPPIVTFATPDVSFANGKRCILGCHLPEALCFLLTICPFGGGVVDSVLEDPEKIPITTCNRALKLARKYEMSDVTQVILAVIINENVRTPNPTTSLSPSKGLLLRWNPDVTLSFQ